MTTETVGPQTVMFIRHGEKPGDGGPPHGIDHDGERDDHALSVRGWTRAGALAPYFTYRANSTKLKLAIPERIIATKANSDYHSKREVNTETPLARRLGLAVDTSFAHDEVAQLSASVLSDGRPTLIVWHHGSMVDLVKTFPIVNLGDVPEKWPHDRFDLIWVLTRAAGQATFQFTSAAQELLDGDEPNPT